MSNEPRKFGDRYWRVLFHRVKDCELLEWLMHNQRIGEKPITAIKRKLYKLMKESKK